MSTALSKALSRVLVIVPQNVISIADLSPVGGCWHETKSQSEDLATMMGCKSGSVLCSANMHWLLHCLASEVIGSGQSVFLFLVPYDIVLLLHRTLLARWPVREGMHVSSAADHSHLLLGSEFG